VAVRLEVFLPVLAVPILVSVHSDLDTTFVTVLRKLSGRAASQGGRDHTSHRLVALGMSERHAVWMLVWICRASGCCRSFVQRAFDLMSAWRQSPLHDRANVNRRLSRRRESLRPDDEEMALRRSRLYAFLVDCFLQTPHLAKYCSMWCWSSFPTGVPTPSSSVIPFSTVQPGSSLFAHFRCSSASRCRALPG